MSKRKMIEQAAIELTKNLTDQGKLIEGGFVIFAHYMLAKGVPKVQYDEIKLAYMAGAEHLFSSIMNILDPGEEEPTDKDLKRMDLIQKEIEDWRIKLSNIVDPVQGSA